MKHTFNSADINTKLHQACTYASFCFMKCTNKILGRSLLNRKIYVQLWRI